MSSWADIQRLASDLQRVQLSAAAKKLSDDNCIEVMSTLIANKMIDVVFTRTGGAYVTRKHLRTEIRNECLGLGGRVALTELVDTLNIDFAHIEDAARFIVADDKNFILSNGELFAKEYVNKLSHELREMLEEDGVRSKALLCRQWNLTADLLKALLLDQLPPDGEFVVDSDHVYTSEYLIAHKMILRAMISAITKVTPLSLLQSRVALPGSRFYNALDELFAGGEVPGQIIGNKNSSNAAYVPNLHGELINLALRRMIAQNDFIQLSQVKKMGVADVKSALKSAMEAKDFDNLVFLPTIVVTKDLVEHQLNEVKAAIEKEKYIRVADVLHQSGIPFDEEDTEYFITKTIKANKQWHSDDGFVFTNELLVKAFESIGSKLDERAEKEVSRLEDMKKNPQSYSNPASGAKSKGAKKAKGKGGKGARDAEEESESAGPSTSNNVFISAGEIETILVDLGEVAPELATAVSEAISDQCVASLRERVLRIIATQATNAAQSHKKSHQQLQQQVSQLYGNICMFDDALEKLPVGLAGDLRAFLQKSLCTELVHAILSFSSGTPNVSQLKEKQRDDVVATLSSDARRVITQLYASLKALTLQEFHDAIFDAAAPSAFSLAMKNPDKKAKTELMDNYTSELLQQVQSQDEPASCLLSAVLHLYAKIGTPVHASGKFVSQLVPNLAPEIDTEIYDLVVDSQKLVVAALKKKDDEEIKTELAEKLTQLKAKLATN